MRIRKPRDKKLDPRYPIHGVKVLRQANTEKRKGVTT